MGWYETKEQRRENRGAAGSPQRHEFDEGHRRRAHGYVVILEKKTGEIVCQARNGCFGRLAEVNPDLYLEWARGTRGGI